MVKKPYFERPQIKNTFFFFLFQEDNAEIAQIRKKELGDWKKITVHEKKVLYRASYCQTFAEMNAPTGEWKMITGMILIALGVSMWMVIWCQKYGKTNNQTIFSQLLIFKSFTSVQQV